MLNKNTDLSYKTLKVKINNFNNWQVSTKKEPTLMYEIYKKEPTPTEKNRHQLKRRNIYV